MVALAVGQDAEHLGFQCTSQRHYQWKTLGELKSFQSSSNTCDKQESQWETLGELKSLQDCSTCDVQDGKSIYQKSSLVEYLAGEHDPAVSVDSVTHEESDFGGEDDFVSFVSYDSRRSLEKRDGEGDTLVTDANEIVKNRVNLRKASTHLLPPNVRRSRIARCISHKQVSSKTLQLPPVLANSCLGRAMVAREKEQRKIRSEALKKQRTGSHEARTCEDGQTLQTAFSEDGASSSGQDYPNTLDKSSPSKVRCRKQKLNPVKGEEELESSAPSCTQANKLAQKMAEELASLEQSTRNNVCDSDLSFALRVSRMQNDGLLTRSTYRRKGSHKTHKSITNVSK